MTKNQRRWQIELNNDETSQDVLFIQKALTKEIDQDFGPAERAFKCILAKDPAQKIIGGLKGFGHWKWFYIQQLWVHQDYRSQGLGAELCQQIQSEAHKMGCVGIYVDTFHPKALQFYIKNGFQKMGSIPEFPPGHERYFLFKKLS